MHLHPLHVQTLVWIIASLRIIADTLEKMLKELAEPQP